MKRVLFISENRSLSAYLCEKFISPDVQVEVQATPRSALIKMLAFRPDLIIFDADIPFAAMTAFLEKKSMSQESAKIPVIIIGDAIEREKLSQLSVYNVVKYFIRPLKIDVFFNLAGKILNVKIPLDKTKCVIDMHVSQSVIFIEVSRGLNQEKMMLLKYQLQELVDIYAFDEPKVVLIISDIHLSFIDTSNLETLFQTILNIKAIKISNVNVLTADPFIKKLILGHALYSKINLLANLSQFGSGLATESAENKKMFNSLQLRFLTDFNDSEEFRRKIKVAVIQTEEQDLRDLGKTLEKHGYKVSCFDKGSDFLMAMRNENFDVLVLDHFSHGISSFDILIQLKNKKNSIIPIVYSNRIDGEAHESLAKLGVETFLFKPDDTCNDVKNLIDKIILEKM